MLLPPTGERRGTGDYAALELAIRVLERRESERPFCIFLALFEPHPPYTICADFYDLYLRADIPAPVPRTCRGARASMRRCARTAAWGRCRRRSCAGCARCTTPRFTIRLAARRAARCPGTHRSRPRHGVLLCSDHGDYTGDYGLVEKWPSGLEDCLTHVPLIARVPGGARGHVVRELIELYDLMPTCLRAGRYPRHAHALCAQPDAAAARCRRRCRTRGLHRGRLQRLRAAGFRAGHRGTLRPQDPAAERASRHDHALRGGAHRGYKYIARPNDQSELYDCRQDPRQENNLYGDAAVRELQAQLQTRLTNWYIDTTGVPPTARDPRGAAVLDRAPQLQNVPTPESLLDH